MVSFNEAIAETEEAHRSFKGKALAVITNPSHTGIEKTDDRSLALAVEQAIEEFHKPTLLSISQIQYNLWDNSRLDPDHYSQYQIARLLYIGRVLPHAYHLHDVWDEVQRLLPFTKYKYTQPQATPPNFPNQTTGAKYAAEDQTRRTQALRHVMGLFDWDEEELLSHVYEREGAMDKRALTLHKYVLGYSLMWATGRVAPDGDRSDKVRKQTIFPQRITAARIAKEFYNAVVQQKISWENGMPRLLNESVPKSLELSSAKGRETFWELVGQLRDLSPWDAEDAFNTHEGALKFILDTDDQATHRKMLGDMTNLLVEQHPQVSRFQMHKMIRQAALAEKAKLARLNANIGAFWTDDEHEAAKTYG